MDPDRNSLLRVRCSFGFSARITITQPDLQKIFLEKNQILLPQRRQK